MAQSVAAALPLITVTSDTDTAPPASAAPDSSASASPLAEPLLDSTPDADGWVTCGDLRVKGGVYGKDYVYTPGNVQYNGTNYGTENVIEVLSSTPLSFSDAAGHGNGSPGTTGIQVNPRVHADITLAGVHIEHRMPFNIMTNADQDRLNPADPTRCHLTLADDTENALFALIGDGYNGAALRCGEGSVLVIDDSVRNTTEVGGNVHDQNREVVPANGAIGTAAVLSNGTRLSAGDPIGKLDAAHPGTLIARGGCNAAGIGGTNRESAGKITVNGGNINVYAYRYEGLWTDSDSMYYQAAGIGGGNCGGISGLTFNSGHVFAQGQIHGAAIGSGTYYLPTRWMGALWADAFLTPDTNDSATFLAGTPGADININGGIIEANGPNHGNAFGDGCNSSNPGHVLRVTGGTLLPDSSRGSTDAPHVDLGFKGGHVIITGGSINCAQTGTSADGTPIYKFDGIGGTAWGNDTCLADGYDPSNPNDPNKVFKVTVNLSSEIEKRNQESGIEDGDLNDAIKT